VAEGVTNSAVVERLKALGVDYAQGNWISPPRPLAGHPEESAAREGNRSLGQSLK
jgi:EAL domain-containing protein (putative c-di-GMP-specific phosphodiesterase class I)